MSRGFLSSLAGLGMTLLAWYGPWEWPAWPAFLALHTVFGRTDTWWELPFGVRAAVLTALIALNVAAWGAVAFLMMRAGSRLTRERPGAVDAE